MREPVYTDENIARYFTGELDVKKIEEMERDLMNDNEKEQQMKDFARLWDKSAEISNYDKLNVNEDWQAVRRKMGFQPISKRISFRKYFIRVAAIIVLAFGLAYLFSEVVTHIPEVEKNDYFQVAAIEEIQEIILPDNSKLTLNKNSKIVYNNNFGETNRDLILEGEAFFEVARNELLPFKVFVGSSTVEVLGTSFNIKPTAKEVLVSVVSGKVAFYETKEKINKVELEVDEQSVFNNKSKAFSNKEALNENYLAWRTGKLKFDGESLGDVFLFLENYFDKKIIVNSAYISSMRLSEAEFKSDESLEDILNYVLLGTGSKYSLLEEGENFLIKINN